MKHYMGPRKTYTYLLSKKGQGRLCCSVREREREGERGERLPTKEAVGKNKYSREREGQMGYSIGTEEA